MEKYGDHNLYMQVYHPDHYGNPKYILVFELLHQPALLIEKCQVSENEDKQVSVFQQQVKENKDQHDNANTGIKNLKFTYKYNKEHQMES